MSIEYKVTFGVFRSISPDTVIEEWKQSLGQNILYKVDDNADFYILFAHGSIRGVSVTFLKKNEINLRLNYYASEKDAEIAYLFLDFLFNKYSAKIFDEDGKKKSEVTIDEMKKDVINASRIGLIDSLLSEEEYLSFPLWDSHVVVYKNEYEEMKLSDEFPMNFNHYLQEKAYKIFLARRAAQIKTKKGTIVSVWAFDDMIVYPCDVIAAQTSSEENIFIKWEDFIDSQFVHYEAIPLGKEKGFYYLIHAIDESQSKQAVGKFKQSEVGIDSL